MEINEQTKICPLCAETIKAAAKVCPHCRFWLNKWSVRSPHTMQGISVLFLVLMIVFFGCFLGRLFNAGSDFVQYQNQIAVVNSGTSFRVSNSNLMVSVIGVLTNQSTVGWKDIGIEAQFFGTDGKMIDVIQAEGDYRELTVLPHSEASFKIEGRAIKPEQEYKSTQVFVRTGKDVRSWP